MESEKKLRYYVCELEKEFDVTVRGKWLKRSVLEVAQRSFGHLVQHVHCDESGSRIEVYSRSIVAVTSVSSSYLPLFEMWLSLVPRSVEVVVCCFDEEVALALPRRCRVIVRSAKTRKEMWLARLDTVIEICRQESRPVFHSDVDAFWFKDVAQFVKEDWKRNVVFSIDHGLGRGDKGFALCCGFYLVRQPDKTTLNFLEKWRRHTEIIGDDQLALNRLYENDYDTVVDLFPYQEVARCNSHHPVLDTPIVWHPWLDADVSTKVKVWTAVLAERDDWSIIRAFYARFGPSAGLQPRTLGDRELREIQLRFFSA